MCAICKFNNILNSRVNSCPKCKYRHNGTCCVDCGEKNIFGKCPNQHDGTFCPDCKKLNVRGKCPSGHDGTSCVVCKELNINGVCKYGHDGTYCIYCKQPNQHNKCVLGHDGTYCVYCKELNQHGECRYFHTGQSCSICDEFKIFQFGWGSVCKTRHTETYCKKCNAPNIHKYGSLIFECPKCYFQECPQDPKISENVSKKPEFSRDDFSRDILPDSLRYLTFTRGDNRNIYQLIAPHKLPYDILKLNFSEKILWP